MGHFCFGVPPSAISGCICLLVLFLDFQDILSGMSFGVGPIEFLSTDKGRMKIQDILCGVYARESLAGGPIDFQSFEAVDFAGNGAPSFNFAHFEQG